MPVTYLEIENFKSYAGRQTVGPFKDFTSVIGPNGSGKSNLMDAISFVLGVQSRDLRSSQMKDLIFRPPGAKVRKQTLRAIVTLIFHDTETDSEIKFARAISPAGQGDYIVDGKSMTFAKYEERLADIGVLVKARNFLVFQGDVESIARKTPKEMVLMLEQISTSIDLAPAYDDALKAKEEAEAAVLFEVNRQRGFKSERRILKEQKEEAERFQELLETKSQLQTDMYLWQLFHIDSDIREQQETLVELRQELHDKQQAEEDLSKALKEAKKTASAARRHTGSVDKARVKSAAQVDKLEPEMIQTTEEIKSLDKKIAAAEKQLAKKKKEEANHAGNLESLEEQAKEQQATLVQLEKDYEEIKRDAVGNQVTLTEDQEEELETVRQAAAAATVKPRRALTGLTRQLNTQRAAAGNLTQEFEEAKKSLITTQTEQERCVDRKKKLSSSLETTKTEWQAKEKDLLEANQSLQASQARREELDREIETINKKLRDAKDSRRKGKDEERLSQAIASLKRHFPGVQGRLVDLCRPTQRRYNLAITVAAGKDMDAIIVDTKETGIECMKHLREQRIGSATFLPLDSIEQPSVESQERVRAAAARDTRFRLAADVISCEDAFRPAVLYAVGNTVVCDDLDCARDICFGGTGRGSANQQAQYKAVTLGGSVISRAGTMTGGVTKEDGNKAGRWDAAEMEKMREKKDTLENERSELDTVADPSASNDRGSRSRSRGSFGHGSRIQELKNEISTLKNKEHFTKGELTYTEKLFRDKEKLLKSLGKQVKKMETDAEKTEASITKLTKEVKQAGEDVKNAEEEHLGPFREKTGLKDFEAYADAVGERRKEFNEQRRQLMEHIAQLEQQKDYETSRDFKKPIASLEKRIVDNEAKLETAKATETELEERVEEAKAELANSESEVKKAADAENFCDEDVQTAQKEYGDAQSDRLKFSKSVNAAEAQIEVLRGTLHETLQKSRVEEVELPLLGDDDDKSDSEEEEEPSGTQSQRSSNTGSQAQTQDSSMPHFSQSDNRKVVRDQQAASKIDYSKLDDQLKQRPSDREERRMQKDFEDQLNKLIAEIENTNPNMKAAETFEIVTGKLKETNSEWSSAKIDSSKKAAAFQKIKKKRTQLFSDCFSHIDESLKTIYTDMTKSSKHPLGGNAYLSLDDTEEPYKGGMKFNAMPPMKRFRDMEQLSGGEKTVAALSLLFAIHSYHPAPFFVMDEVDAALDNINLRKVCNYISQRSKTDFQCIVISLKDMFYERSESLVGVCRDVGTSSSRTLTLDLTAFDKKKKRDEPKNKKRGTKRKSKSDGAGGVSPSPKRASRSRRSIAAAEEEEGEGDGEESIQ